jgi:hypothetical protein
MTADMVQQLQLDDDVRGFAQNTLHRLDVNAATVMAAANDARAATAGLAGEIRSVVA